MSIRVFDWAANPAIDPRSYKLSNARAIELVDAGTHFIVKCGDGGTGIQAYPPPEERTLHGRFQDAWKMKPSGGIPVWQMVTKRWTREENGYSLASV
jgi:hypothetical protein